MKFLAEFYPAKRRPSGGRYISAWCRVCHARYANARRGDLVRLVVGTSVNVAIPNVLAGRGRPRSLTEHLDAAHLAYLAGIVDGEGCINIGLSTNITINLYIGNTSGALILWLYNTIGGSWSPVTMRELNRKQFYHWGLGGAAAVRLLRLLLPYLVIKARHAESAIACYEAVVLRDMPLAAQHAVVVRTLNARGVNDVG